MTGAPLHPRFEALLEQHRRIIFKIASVYARGAEDRRDLAQDIATQLWRAFPSYDEHRARFSTWMYRIALNVAISFHRRERRHRDLRLPIDDDAVTIAAASETRPTADLQLLLRCVDDLSALDKALVVLYLDGNDHASIADVLGISVSNVGTRLGRIKDKLRAAFAQHAREPQGGPDAA